MKWLVNRWFQPNSTLFPLAPFANFYQRIVLKRRQRFLSGHYASYRAPVPVVVIGNITVGGTGKTPLVIACVEFLKQLGLQPGVVSRGYGGKAPYYPFTVDASTLPTFAGDEPVLIAQSTQVPVVVDPHRSRAVQELLAKFPSIDVIISDDGLQHYALARDLEIVVVDERGFGNQHCLPRGPLREPLSRLATIDFLIQNTEEKILIPNGVKLHFHMRLQPEALINVQTKEVVAINSQRFAEIFTKNPVYAMAGIGNPARFFKTLQKLNLEIKTKIFPDHHRYQKSDLAFPQDWPVIMTAKDAVKCHYLLRADQNQYWYLAVGAVLDDQFYQHLLLRIKGLL